MNIENLEINDHPSKYVDEDKEVIYKNIPLTKTFKIKGFSNIEWELPVPEMASVLKTTLTNEDVDDQTKPNFSPFFEKSEKGYSRFSKEGRQLALQTWNVVVAASGGEKTDEEIILRNFRKITDMDLYPEEYRKLLNKSFKSRIAWNRKLKETSGVNEQIEKEQNIVIETESNNQELHNKKEDLLNKLRSKYKEVEIKIRTASSSFKEKLPKPNIDIKSVANISLIITLITGAFAEIRNSKIDLTDYENNDPKKLQVSYNRINKLLPETPNGSPSDLENILPTQQSFTEAVNILPIPTEISTLVTPVKNAVIYQDTSVDQSEIKSPYIDQGVDFSKQNPITLSFEISDTKQEQNENIPPLNPLTATPLLYADSFSADEKVTFGQEEAPGTGNVWTDVDEYGNIIVGCHSGYYGSNPLECEGLRQFLQGGNAEHPAQQLSKEEIQERITILDNSRVEISDNQGNNIMGTPTVGYIPPEMTEDLYNNTKDMLEAVILATGGEKSPFVIYRNGNGIGLFFCAWGKPGEENWWSKGAWVIFFNADNSVNKTKEFIIR
jgi:hypothetical protein